MAESHCNALSITWEETVNKSNFIKQIRQVFERKCISTSKEHQNKLNTPSHIEHYFTNQNEDILHFSFLFQTSLDGCCSGECLLTL